MEVNTVWWKQTKETSDVVKVGSRVKTVPRSQSNKQIDDAMDADAVAFLEPVADNFPGKVTWSQKVAFKAAQVTFSLS